jgi:hypothetical protein
MTMKKLFYLLNGLLLTAALAACSSEYDDPPEQPNSHQNEVPIVDSLGTETSQDNKSLYGKWYLFRQDGYNFYMEKLELGEDGTFVIKTNGFIHSNQPRTEKCTYRITEGFKYDEETHMDKATVYVYHRKISYNSHNENDSTRCDFYLKGDTLMFRYYETSDSYFFNILVNAGSKPEKWYVRDTNIEDTYTTISPIQASDDVEAFFNEALPTICDSTGLGNWVKYIGDFRLEEPVELMGFNIISDQETFESKYIGNKTLPHIDFNKYCIIFGRYLLGVEETINYIDIQPIDNDYYVILHTTDPTSDNYEVSYSAGEPHYYYNGIEGRLKSFWGIFPKDLPVIWSVFSERSDVLRLHPVEVNNSVKDFLNEALPNDKGVSTFRFHEKNEKEFLAINSQQELEEAYRGEADLPAIDFNKHTLIIGKAYMPGKYYHVKSMEIHDYNGNLMLYVQTDNPESLFWMAYNMYFWALFPKIEQEIASISIIPEN